jgi:transcription initiation protein SPT3
MMHGFGDARTPLMESASLIETVVQQQQQTLISRAADVAAMRGAKCIGLEDILFLLRKDRIKTHRLIKYLGTSMLPSDEDEYSVTDCLKCLSEEM